MKMKIANKTYDLSSNLNKSIVLISDIHYYEKEQINHLNKVLDNIKKINPDYICITGDITDKANIPNFDDFMKWLNKLANITKVIMVLGNHEYYVNKRKHEYKLNEFNIDRIKKIKNLYLLDNDNLILDNINFIGLTLPIEHYMYQNESKEDIRLFTTFNNGAYYELRGYKIFVEARPELYFESFNGKQDLMNDYTSYMSEYHTNKEYQEFLDKYNFDYLCFAEKTGFRTFLEDHKEYDLVLETEEYTLWKCIKSTDYH